MFNTELQHYFGLRHNEVSFDYLDESKENLQDSAEIAFTIASYLKQEGCDPKIIVFRSPPRRLYDEASLSLLPYEGRVDTVEHSACYLVDDDIVFDPILERPTRLGEYIDQVFGEQDLKVEILNYR